MVEPVQVKLATLWLYLIIHRVLLGILALNYL